MAYNQYNPSTLSPDPYPYVWRIWIDGEMQGDFTIAQKRKLEADCAKNGKTFKADYIGKNVSSGRKRLYES